MDSSNVKVQKIESINDLNQLQKAIREGLKLKPAILMPEQEKIIVFSIN